MKLDLFSILYLFFRLVPFAIITLFTISPFLWKGLTYLLGLIMIVVINILFSNFLSRNVSKSPTCDLFNFIGAYGEHMSFSITALFYSFAYLLYPSVVNELLKDNVYKLVFLGIICLGDLAWNISYECYSTFNMISYIITSLIFGFLWSRIVDNSELSTIKMVDTKRNHEVCKKMNDNTFRCSSKLIKDPPIQQFNEGVEPTYTEPGHTHNEHGFQDYSEMDNISYYLPNTDTSGLPRFSLPQVSTSTTYSEGSDPDLFTGNDVDKNNTDVIADTIAEYPTEHQRFDDIVVGSSTENIKIITLPEHNMTVLATPLNKVPIKYKFTTKVDGKKLTVQRTDNDGGWLENIKLRGYFSEEQEE